MVECSRLVVGVVVLACLVALPLAIVLVRARVALAFVPETQELYVAVVVAAGGDGWHAYAHTCTWLQATTPLQPAHVYAPLPTTLASRSPHTDHQPLLKKVRVCVNCLLLVYECSLSVSLLPHTGKQDGNEKNLLEAS